jgi:hypothetical protein
MPIYEVTDYENWYRKGLVNADDEDSIDDSKIQWTQPEFIDTADRTVEIAE